MLKKYASLCACILMLLSFAACGNDFDPDTYVGEGVKTRLGVLVDANQTFYNEVFVLGRLAVDEKSEKEYDGKSYAPVTDTAYPDYQSLELALKEVYTDDAVKDILKQYDFYKDIDGKLCLDMSSSEASNSGNKWKYDRSTSPELKDMTDNSYTFRYAFISGEEQKNCDFTFVNTESGYRLAELKPVD